MTGAGAEDFRDSFFEECEELLEAMQDGFDLLARASADEGTMHAIFRAVHSIKGGAGAFGLSRLVAFAHQFETALDHVRSGRQAADAESLDLFRACADALADLVATARDHGDRDLPQCPSLLARLSDTFGIDPDPDQEPAPDFDPVRLDLELADDPAVARERTFRIEFSARPALFATGHEPRILFRTLERFGALSVEADVSAVPPLTGLDNGVCHLAWAARLVTTASEPEIAEVFEFVADACDFGIGPLEDAPCADPGPAETSAGRARTPPGLPADDVSGGDTAHADVPSLAAMLGGDVADGADMPGGPVPAMAADTDPVKVNAAPDHSKRAGTIRVDLEKIDRLINLVGELVIKEAMLSQSIAAYSPPTESDVSVGLESLKQLAGEIQEGVMAIRAQPVKPMFQRMARIVREASAATGKRVRFVTTGETTEVDKTVIERLVDPMTHMIRNAIDHGLESAEDRAARGKAPEGTINLSAAHRSGRVMIDVSDDGGGIDRDKVRALAVGRGLIQETDVLSPAEIDNLLFLPGFSSKEEVSELSGRGVGLDVVRSEIQTLGGRVSIHSDPGEGTTFSISLPLTLAVLEGMVIRVADQTMVVPISAIQETLQPAAASLHHIGSGGLVLRNRNALLPIIDLGAFFGFREMPSDLRDQVLLLIEADSHHRYALVVDDIQDQRQVVIKSLETNYQQVRGVAAATILGDGRIALIIDPDNIVKPGATLGAGDLSLQLAG